MFSASFLPSMKWDDLISQAYVGTNEVKYHTYEVLSLVSGSQRVLRGWVGGGLCPLQVHVTYSLYRLLYGSYKPHVAFKACNSARPH